MKRKALILLFLLLSCFSSLYVIPGVQAQTYYFESDFDDWDGSDFTDWDHSDYCDQVTWPTYSGLYAANATTDAFHLMHDFTSSPGDKEVYIRFAIRWTNLEIPMSPSRNILLCYGEDASTEQFWLFIHQNNSQTVLALNSDTFGNTYGSIPLASDTWYSVQCKFEVSATSESWVEINGVQDIVQSGDNDNAKGSMTVEFHANGVDLEYDHQYLDWVIIDDEEILAGPYNEEITITNMEGCGNWVFTDHRWYHFRAIYSHASASGNASEYLDHCQVTFNDGEMFIGLDYDAQSGAFQILGVDQEEAERKINLADGGTSESGQNLTVIFDVWFNEPIFDGRDIDLLMMVNDTAGVQVGWQTMQVDYFNIYNLGGDVEVGVVPYYWGENATGGRLAGGEAFNLWVGNSSMAKANMTFRNLAHAKFHVKLNWTHIETPFGQVEWQFGFHYCVNDTWLEGFRVVIQLIEYYKNSTTRWARWYVGGYDREWNYIGHDYIYSYFDYQEFTGDLWVDLWFNKMNASSTWGTRVTAYYFGMETGDPWWWRLITGGTWGAAHTDENHALIAGDLVTDDGSIVFNTQEIEMLKLWARVVRGPHSNDSITSILELVVFDTTFIDGEFEGIQTPAFEDSKVPTMPQGGIVGVIFSALAWIGNAIVEALGPGVLALWDAFVGFLDSIAGAFGQPTFFSDLFSWLGSFASWLASSFVYAITLLTSFFAFLASSLGSFLGAVAVVLQYWASMASTFLGFLGTGLGTGLNLWNDLGLTNWVILAAVLYPIWLIYLWEERGIDAVVGNVMFLINGFMFLFNIFLGVIQLFLNMIGRIIESIPIVE